MKKQITNAFMALSFISSATVASAGTFLTAAIDSDFSEWASVPTLDSDAADNVGSVDIATIKLANDNDFLYVYYSHHTASSLGTFMAIDYDSNLTTGFDIFGLGLIGADAQWQNDFPFTSDAGSFNNGLGMTGDFFGSGAALLNAFTDDNQHELAISLDVLFNEVGKGALFDDPNFTFLLWTDQGAGDVSAPISYTLAVPEPSTSALFGMLGFLAFRRRR